ncbi:hypothetical protein [Chitinimonas sp.]|uniref:hypothetical protein n=1 Tax=Chitinimonas sp. TaxID=1934313 RepID=UPI0035B18D05
MLSRRQLIKTGLAGALLLGTARLAHGPFRAAGILPFADERHFRILDAPGRTAMAAIARVMLADALPTESALRQAAIEAAVHGCDVAIAGLPLLVQEEVKDLLALLNQPLSRRWLLGVQADWLEADDIAIANFLTRWRYSSFSLMRSGYQALHQIVFAAWYGSTAAWGGIGYEGPPAFMKDFWNA